MAEDFQVIRRLIRDAFSDITSLSERIGDVEQGLERTNEDKKQRNGFGLSGVVDLTAGSFLQKVHFANSEI